MRVARITMLLLVMGILGVNTSSTLSADNFVGCETTQPNGSTPPKERASSSFYGNGTLWTALWPDGTVVFRPRGPGFLLRDGSLKMKFPWWRNVPDKLTIEGRRLDASAPPLRVHIGKADRKDFVPTYLIFPTEGCWEVTGKAGNASLTFVTRVIKVGYRK